MAPDVNGFPKPSQPSNTASSSTQQSPSISRRTSSVMGPPPVPQNNSLPNSPRPTAATVDSTAFGVTTGPIRHPRPLTAAELHLELEKEQESIVNRLTRELSALRAQTASVASTASSTSDLFPSSQTEPYLSPYQSTYGIPPTSARRHRSSSNLSSRSARSAREGLTNSATATSVSGVAAPRERERDHSLSLQNSSRPSIDLTRDRPVISRQNSTGGGPPYRVTSSSVPTSAGLPSPHWPQHPHPHSHHQHHPHPHPYPTSQSSRHSISSQHDNPNPNPNQNQNQSQSQSHSHSLGRSPGTRYEEVAHQRAELEATRRENEALRQRVKDLERLVAAQSPPDLPPDQISQTVSSSASALASASTARVAAGPATATAATTAAKTEETEGEG